MIQAGIRGVMRQGYKPTTVRNKRDRPAPDLVNRAFHAEAPAHHGKVIELKLVYHRAHGANVVLDGQLGGLRESTVARTRKIEEMTSHMRGQVGKQLAKRGAAGGPSVHEDHIWARAHGSVRHFTLAHIDEALGRRAKQIGSLLDGYGHQVSV